MAKKGLDKFVSKAHGPSGTQNITPWYYRWKKWFLDKARFKDHELLDQPICFAYFVLANDPDPLSSITIMKMDEQRPSQYTN